MGDTNDSNTEDWNALPEQEFAEKLVAQADDQGPALTHSDMDIIEECWEKRRAARRCALILLTKPFKEIREGVGKNREFALAVAEVISCNENLDFYKGIHEFLVKAKVWGSIALAGREDMEEIFAEVDNNA